MSPSLPSPSKLASAVAGTAILAFIIPYMARLRPLPSLLAFVPDFPFPDYPLPLPFFQRASERAPEPYACLSQPYQTEIISLDPLLIYVRDFFSAADISALLAVGDPRFEPSEVIKYGREIRTTDRTSSSAGLPRDDVAVQCVLGRARSFLGTMMTDGWDEMGPPQLVRYTAGQRFNLHHDWYESPRWANDETLRKWNRIASFFVILQDNCTGGETYFPYVQPVSKQEGHERATDAGTAAAAAAAEDWEWSDDDPAWREHEDGGVAFRPIAGNAVFWVNLHANGTGDRRTMHAGLPVGGGLKTAMNIWPRQYYAWE